MNEDFEEDYEEDDDGLQDFQDAIDKGKDAKDKFNKEREARAEKKQSQGSEGSSGTPKGDSPPSKPNAVNESSKKAGKEVTKQSSKEVTKEAGKQVAKEAGKQAATKTAVTATKAIPYVGAIIAALDAAISMIKAINKHDKKMREKGIDTKNMRRLFLATPLLIPILIVMLIIVILAALTQGTTTDRVQILQDALVCFETSGEAEHCKDFMNTGVTFGEYRLREKIFSEGIDMNRFQPYDPWNEFDFKPLIKRTDQHISWFLNDFLLIEKALNINSDFEFTDTLLELVPLEFDNTSEYNEDQMIDDMKESGLLTEDNPDEIQKTDVYTRQTYLYKWLKMEKKIFNQIKWKWASINTSNIGWWNDIQNGVVFIAFNKVIDPLEEFKSEVKRDYSWIELDGTHDWLTTAYLKVPREIELDEAISLAEPYLPSFIEIYATLMATGSYSMADRVYQYYLDNIKDGGTMPLEITIFEQMSLKTIYKDLASMNQTKTYYINTTGNTSSGWQEISEAQYNSLRDDMEAEIKSQSQNSSIWDKIVGFFVEIWEDIEKAAADVGKWISDKLTEITNIMGWDTEITRDFIAVVEKGHAYEYKVNRTYKMDAETYVVEVNDVQKEEKIEKFPEDPIRMDVEYSYEYEKETDVCEEWYPTVEGETPECKKYKTEIKTSSGTSSNGYLQLQVKSTITWDQEHTITENIIKPELNEIEKYTDKINGEDYEYENRYLWVLDQIEEEEREAYKEEKEDAIEAGTLNEFLKNYMLVSANEMAFAVDIIDAHYSETFGLLGSIATGDFIVAGDLNASLINYAKQFEGYKLDKMMLIDDTNTFYAGHWCAMFVSFCMKKVNVPIPSFYQCAKFWKDNQDKTGFFDVAGADNYGYITSDPTHVTTLNNIQAGDIILFKTSVNNRARTHTGICVSVEKDVAGNVAKITAIEGNTGNPNFNRSKVSIQTYTGSSLKTIASFVSVAMVEASGGWT